MELRQQLDEWIRQADAAGEDAKANFDVVQRLLKHGIGALDEIERLRGALDAATAAEREACAKIAESLTITINGQVTTGDGFGTWVADVIRERSKQDTMK